MSNYEKYIKYKQKYLLSKSNNINGGTTPTLVNGRTSPIPFNREESKYVSNQRNEGTCYAHVVTRMLTRIIKMQYSDIFPITKESCNYYYDTQKCVIDNTIFDCFYYISKNKEHGCETATLDMHGENMSALLFHYIYTFIRDTFGCKGGSGDLSILYFLIHLKYDNITVDSIKKQLNYNDDKYKIENNFLTRLFFSKSSTQTYFNKIIETLNEVLNNYKHILLNNNVNVYGYYPIFNITKFIDLLKIVLDNNYYAYIGGCSNSACSSFHAVLISDLINEGSDTFLIIKNSWGTSSRDIPTMGIINNKININWLIKNNDNIRIIFLAPSELIQSNSIFNDNNKFIINEFDFVDLAIRLNNIDIAKIAIKKINVNARNKNGETTLILASKKEYIVSVQYLLIKPDIDVNAKDYNGSTALMWACNLNSDSKIIEALLNTPSIDINTPNNNNNTPLIYTAMNTKEHIKIVENLLKMPNININIKNNSGYTALSYAALNGHTKIVRALLSVPGIEINISNNAGGSALILSAWKGYTEIVKALLSSPGIDINSKNINGYSALMSASQSGHIEIVRILLEMQDIDINIKSHEGKKAIDLAKNNDIKMMIINFLKVKLFDACSKGDKNAFDAVVNKVGIHRIFEAMDTVGLSSAQVLLKPDEKNDLTTLVNSQDKEQRTCLVIAVDANHTEIVKRLSKIPGIDANRGKIYGWTAIILAARYGRNELVQALISIPGININSKNYTETTALMSAAKYGHTETVKILLNVTDINVTAKDNEGKTAFDLASNDEIKKLLIKTDDDLDKITINYIKKNISQ